MLPPMLCLGPMITMLLAGVIVAWYAPDFFITRIIDPILAVDTPGHRLVILFIARSAFPLLLAYVVIETIRLFALRR